MPQEVITDLLRSLVDIIVLCIIALTLKLAFTKPMKPLEGDVDFEEFYMDLCQSDFTVDFTRQEAEVLYRTSQRQEKIAR